MVKKEEYIGLIAKLRSDKEEIQIEMALALQGKEETVRTKYCSGSLEK